MIIPIVAGLIYLGSAFDLYRITPTNYQIIDSKDIKANVQITPRNSVEKHYRIVQSASDVNLALNLDPLLSLKAKNEDRLVLGLNIYLSEVVNRNSTVEILLVVDYQTENVSFPPHLRLDKKTLDVPQSKVGTHYVSSMQYGGMLVASVVIHPLEPKYLSVVKKAVEAKIAKSGSIDELFFGELERVARSLHTKANITITTAATAGLFDDPTNLTELARLVQEYPEIVKRSFPRGHRMRIELEEIHKVNSNYSRFEANRELIVLLEEANEKFEDLRIAEKLYQDWKSTNPAMKSSVEELIKEFWSKLQAAKEALSSAISDLTFNGEINQLEEAFAVYNQLKVEEPYRYTYFLGKTIEATNNKSFFGRLYHWFIRFLKSVLRI